MLKNEFPSGGKNVFLKKEVFQKLFVTLIAILQNQIKVFEEILKHSDSFITCKKYFSIFKKQSDTLKVSDCEINDIDFQFFRIKH